MRKNFEFALSEVLKYEGGFVNDPHDPGGMTNKGITAKTYAEYTGRRISTITEQEMRNLPDYIVTSIYKRKYWDVCKCDSLPDGLDFQVFDYAVNSGPGRAIKHLQECLAVEADGLIGPDTLKHISDKPISELIKEYGTVRLDFLRSLPTFKFYGNGWTSRVNKTMITAMCLITDIPELKPKYNQEVISRIDEETRQKALASVK